MEKLKGVVLVFFIGILIFGFGPIGLDALKKLWEIERNFDKARYAAELELAEKQELDDARKRRHEENRWRDND